MSKFHNPYHFVPVPNTIRKEEWDSAEEMKGVQSGETLQLSRGGHGRYPGKDRYHGRIICKLKTETPIFIGGKRINDGRDNEPAEVEPYELNGQPAIPASTLRGMISSIAEAASSSALRVLENRRLSRRMVWAQKKESLQALGLLCKFKGSNELKLLPLTLPTMPCDAEGRLKKPENSVWRDIFKVPNLKVYLNKYTPKDKMPSYESGTFLGDKRPKSFSAGNQEFWYLKLGEIKWKNKFLNVDHPRIKSIETKRGPVYFLTGQHPSDSSEAEPVSEATYEKKSKEKKALYKRGILRVLGIDNDREKEIPKEKKHEIFIPLPDKIEHNTALDITDALARFHELADERTKADEKYPFELKGSARNNDSNQFKSKIRLKEGDIVFFDTKDGKKVSELSISSIWRRSSGGTVHDYFSRMITPREDGQEILPFHPNRKLISPAERAFGFTEERQDDHKSKGKAGTQALAFKSPVRFSAGILELKEGDREVYLDPVPLKILDSPKPPCPALYFKGQNSRGEYIPVDELKPGAHHPQGRKFYLHKCKKDSNKIPWKTKEDERWKQKVKITPLSDNLTFYFHIDFDNLTQYELEMLCYALKPDKTFQHKVGMGKPLGLGSVSIEPVGILFINRQKRYCTKDPFESPRYHEVFGRKETLSDLPAQYAMEKAAAETAEEGENKIDAMREEFMETMDQKVAKAISQIGHPDNVAYPVRYPHSGDLNVESELFRWFENNKKKNEMQSLEPLPTENGILPFLETN